MTARRVVAPMRRSVAVLALAACMGCTPPAQDGPLRTNGTPEETVRRIYTLPNPNFDAFHDPAQRPFYYTARIVSAIEATERCFMKQFGMDHLDFDYIVPGQDYDIRDFHLEVIERRRGEAHVKVRFRNFPDAAPMELLYHMKHMGGRWLIDDTIYDGHALSESLKGDC